MKKILILSAILLSLFLIACSNKEDSSRENTMEETTVADTSENVTETTVQTYKTIESTTETTTTTTAQTVKMPKAEKLNLEELDKDSYDCNKRKNNVIFYTDYGRYYYVEIGGRNSANYVLCLDRGYGEPEILTDTEDCSVMYYDNNALYLSKYFWGDSTTAAYKLEGNELTEIEEYPLAAEKCVDDYIYSAHVDESESNITFYRTDTDGNNKEEIVTIKYKNYFGSYYTVYDDKIWYEYYKGEIGDYTHRLAFYDIKTGETKEFESGKIGLINNGYMYYINKNELLRFNLSSYECEYICEADKNDKYLCAFNFYKNYILYSSNGSLYRLNDNEKTLIFSSKEFFNTDYYYELDAIQCQDDRIFIRVTSGPFYTSIFEIDIDGNVIEFIHEG